MKKALAVLALSLSLVCALALPAAAAETVYSDTQDHYAERAISAWSGYGVLKGYEDGTFRPNGVITRAEMAAVLDRIMGYEETVDNTWRDLRDELWYRDSILHLAAQGIFNGDNKGRMKPEAPITREEAVAALARALAVAPEEKAPGFYDDDEIADWSKGYIAGMKKAGYVTGDTNGKFRPSESITRADIVTLLDRMVAGFINADGEYSEDCRGNLIVNAKDVKLKDMAVKGDLIIADGVGKGDVYLENVEVKGSLVVRGGGENSIHIVGDASKYGAIIITKTASGRVRLVSEKGAVIPIINMQDGTDGVLLEGISGTNVVIENDVDVKFGKGVKNVKVGVNAPGASVTLADGATAARVNVSAAAADSKVTVEKGAKVNNLTAAAKATISNSGTISKASVQASDVTIDGKRPSSTTVALGVKKPTYSNSSSSGSSSSGGGSSSGGSSSGGSSSGGGSSTPTPTPTPAPTPEPTPDPVEPVTPSVFLSEVTVLLDSPRTGITAARASGGVEYVAQVDWTPALTDGKFAANTAYTATLTIRPASGEYAFNADVVNNVHLKRTALNYGAEGTMERPTLENGKIKVKVAYPATGDEVKIVASLTDGDRVNDTTNSLVLYEGMHSQWMRIEARLEAGGKTVSDRPIKYEWHCDKQKEGESYYLYSEGSSAHWNYTVPAYDLEQGTYNYICKITADGCAPLEVKYNVTVKDSTNVKLDFSKAYMHAYGDNGVVIDYSAQPDPEDPSKFSVTTVAPQKLRVTYTFTRENGTQAVHVDWGGWLNHDFDLVQNFYNAVYVDGWYPTADTAYEDRTPPIGRMEKTTITNIRLEALKTVKDETAGDGEDKWKEVVIAGPYDYKCNIKFLPQATQMKADEENFAVYDPTTDTLTFNGLKNGKSNDYYSTLFCSFIIDGWRTLCWRINNRSDLSYPFPVASINSDSLQQKLHNGEEVVSDVRTIAARVGGFVGGPEGLDAGDAEIYIEYVEGVKSVVKDSAGT